MKTDHDERDEMKQSDSSKFRLPKEQVPIVSYTPQRRLWQYNIIIAIERITERVRDQQASRQARQVVLQIATCDIPGNTTKRLCAWRSS